MSATSPPDPNVNTFNNLYWITGDNTLTQDQADKRYLRFPTAQGTENLQAINVNGLATFNDTIVVADGTENSTISQDAVFNSLTISNNVNSGAIFLRTTNSSGVSTNPLSITSDIFNINSASSGIIGAGNNTMSISSSGITNTKPIVLNGAANTDRIINNVYYQLQDQNALSTTTGQIFASSGVFNYDNDANGGTHNFATNTAGGVQTIPLSFSSTDMSIATTNPPTQSATQPASSDSSTKMPTTAWVQGAVSRLLTLNNTWTGTNAFNNASPPTSSSTQPASSDSSTNMPTTAWVQTAVSRLLSLNNTWTGTNAFNNASPPTSTSTQPAFNDSSTKMPTTAWVQGAISAGASSAVPVGSTIAYAGANTAPAGWLFCQGQDVSRTTYATLFAVIGTIYGNGDGSTTFTLPKMMSGDNNYGIFPAGSAQTSNNGFIVNGGSVNVVYFPQISTAYNSNQKLSFLQIPNHSHSITFPTANYVNNVNTTNNTSTGGSGARAVNGSQSTFPTATDTINYGNLKTQADYVPIYTAFCWIIKY